MSPLVRSSSCGLLPPCSSFSQHLQPTRGNPARVAARCVAGEHVLLDPPRDFHKVHQCSEARTVQAQATRLGSSSKVHLCHIPHALHPLLVGHLQQLLGVFPKRPCLHPFFPSLVLQGGGSTSTARVPSPRYLQRGVALATIAACKVVRRRTLYVVVCVSHPAQSEREAKAPSTRRYHSRARIDVALRTSSVNRRKVSSRKIPSMTRPVDRRSRLLPL